MVAHNPELYRRMSQPHITGDSANEALAKFFDGVAKLREEYCLPDVCVIVEVNSIGASGKEQRGHASAYFGDLVSKLPMVARHYGEARAEYEDMLHAAIEGGRDIHSRRPRR